MVFGCTQVLVDDPVDPGPVERSVVEIVQLDRSGKRSGDGDGGFDDQGALLLLEQVDPVKIYFVAFGSQQGLVAGCSVEDDRRSAEQAVAGIHVFGFIST